MILGPLLESFAVVVNLIAPNRSGWEPNLEYAGRITVEDTKGRRLQIHEYRGRRLLRHTQRFLLENGERVDRVDFDNYLVAKSGVRLIRIK